MGLNQSKKQYQNCNDSIWMDTTVTVDFSKSVDRELESINFDNIDQKSSKANMLFAFFQNIGNKFKRRPHSSTKKFDDIELDPIQSGSHITKDTFFGKLKSAVRPKSAYEEAPGGIDDDDSHGLIL
jgi:hypothetical protein